MHDYIEYICLLFLRQQNVGNITVKLPQFAALWHGTSNATVVDRVLPEMLYHVHAHW